MIFRARLRAWIAALAVSASAVAVVALPATVAPVTEARAADASGWNPGNIIDDALFYDSNALDANGVQAFLNQQVRTCSAGYTCLKDYRQNTDNRPADRFCNGYTGRANESAAQIIDTVARSCGISQKVILVLLQKEQSLVTSTAPSKDQWAAAAGQGCPDTAPCDPSTAGFFYQVYYAARQYEIYRLTPTSWGYQAGRWNNILYHPTASRGCGSASVYIENQATAGLYIYTPYVPNAAALRNLYGTGDNCSSYGNRNFWRLYTDWFGSTHSYNNPFGNVELIAAGPGEFRVTGWAADLDTTAPISIHVYAGSQGTAFTADLERADVGAAYPAVGSRHGFNVKVPAVGAGSTNVCVYGINAGQGANVLLRCQQIKAMSGPPVGKLDAVKVASGSVAVSGWAIDPDSAGPTSVHVYVDAAGTALKADRTRSGLSTSYPAYGTNHGFAATLPASPGVRSVCAYAINIGPGGTTPLGCQTVTIPGAVDLGRAPFGALESVAVSGSSATVKGWAIDPDTAAPIKVHLYVGASGAEYTADKARADVAAAYPGTGSNHGFAEKVKLPVGTTQVCAYGINNGAGGHTLLGCKSATVAPDLGRAPFGNFESLNVAGNVATASGWAIDPDTAAPIKVHLYAGAVGTEYTADKPRADVGAAYPAAGANHGFVEKLTLPAGTTQVCAYAINNGAGGHTLLGCKSATVAESARDLGRAPLGNFEGAAAAPGGATVSGWALDPDTTASIKVHIYVGAVGAEYTANKPRADVGAAYRLGDNHGFSEFVPMPSGRNTVCVYAINTGAGGPTLVGCREVIVP